MDPTVEQFQLIFDNRISELEKENRWATVVKIVTQQWEKNPSDLNRLLCAGSQLWYTLLIMDYIRNDPFPPEYVEFVSDAQLQDDLMRVTRYGFIHWGDSSVFNAYFGYMIKTMPYLFLDYEGDYLGWQSKGMEMMRNSYKLDSSNPFAKAMYFESGDCGKGSPFYNACEEIWKKITPEQWGSSEVQQYFFRILHGDSFYPDAYSRG